MSPEKKKKKCKKNNLFVCETLCWNFLYIYILQHMRTNCLLACKNVCVVSFHIMFWLLKRQDYRQVIVMYAAATMMYFNLEIIPCISRPSEIVFCCCCCCADDLHIYIFMFHLTIPSNHVRFTFYELCYSHYDDFCQVAF